MNKVFSVRDVKADSYGALICCPTRGIALRVFAEACANPQSPMSQYPADFSLYEVGDWDASSGTLVGHKVPEYVASAAEVIQSMKSPTVAVEAEVAK